MVRERIREMNQGNYRRKNATEHGTWHWKRCEIWKAYLRYGLTLTASFFLSIWCDAGLTCLYTIATTPHSYQKKVTVNINFAGWSPAPHLSFVSWSLRSVRNAIGLSRQYFQGLGLGTIHRVTSKASTKRFRLDRETAYVILSDQTCSLKGPHKDPLAAQVSRKQKFCQKLDIATQPEHAHH